MRYQTGSALVLVGVMLVAACSTEPVDEPQNDSTTATSTTVAVATDATAGEPSEGDDPIVNTPTPTTPPLSTERTYDGETYPTELTGLVTGAITDLADRLGVDTDSVFVLSVEEVVWPNGALGCPKPGMAYTQVTVDGLLIVLAHGGSEYRYHSGGSIDPFLCLPGPGAVKEPDVPQIDITDPDTYPGATTEGSPPSADTGVDDQGDGSVPTEQLGGPGDPGS